MLKSPAFQLFAPLFLFLSLGRLLFTFYQFFLSYSRKNHPRASLFHYLSLFFPPLSQYLFIRNEGRDSKFMDAYNSSLLFLSFLPLLKLLPLFSFCFSIIKMRFNERREYIFCKHAAIKSIKQNTKGWEQAGIYAILPLPLWSSLSSPSIASPSEYPHLNCKDLFLLQVLQ